MRSGVERLREDLEILEAMAADMAEYLPSDVLYWKMSSAWMPMLTLGGYLMREYRLLTLRDLLDSEEQARLDTAVAQFNQAIEDKVVRFEQKAKKELGVRTRQWGRYLDDLRKEPELAGINYETAVTNRVMITAMFDRLQTPPYQLDGGLKETVETLDKGLRTRWQSGEFVWPADWKPAYPQEKYWWLYGRPH
ncbi:MAG TPA: hypothetical protein EYP41_05590 [Anaerolineae bacterium]|nr:hypothetical protein [Anaerolineae bacterium]